jgi:hypothetical protein
VTQINEPMDERVDMELTRVRETLRAARGQARSRREGGEDVFKSPRRNGADEAREVVEGGTDED